MLDNFLRLNTSIGIELHINYDNSININACKIVTKRNQLHFEEKLLDLNSVEELSNHFPKKSVVALNINGKGVLHKKIGKADEITPANFSQILPNANIDDFYIQNFISGEFSFVSVIRKEDADKCLMAIKSLDYIIVMLSLGPFPVELIFPQLNVYDSTIIFNGHTVDRIKDEGWLDYRYDSSAKAPYPIKIENETISEKLLISYAIALQLIFEKKASPVQVNIHSLQTTLTNVLFKSSIKVYSLLTLIICLLILGINTIFNYHLRNENQKVLAKINNSSFSQTDKSLLESEIKRKELILQNLYWDGGISKAYLISQLASELPPEIKWKEIAINPIDESQRQTSGKLIFLQRQIHIKGTSNRMYPINLWMATLREKEWIKAVQVVNFIYSEDENTGNFHLLIKF